MRAPHSLTGLIEWLKRPQWADLYAAASYEHMGQACDDADLDWDEVASALGEGTVSNLWGATFEDFLTRENNDGLNIVDDYLKRRGWKETKPTKHYMAALRHSTSSLYEVSGIVPGESFLLRDLIRGGEPIRVSERSGSMSLKQWDHIAVRVIELGSKIQIGGAVLVFHHELSRELLDKLKEGLLQLPERRKEAAAAQGLDADDPILLEIFSEHYFLRAAAPMYTQFWLEDALEQLSGQQPSITVNEDEEDLVFVIVRYPFAPGVATAEVGAALTEIPDFRPEDGDFWTWERKAGAAGGQPSGAIDGPAAAEISDDGSAGLGLIELEGRSVILSVNSVERAKAGRAILEAALGPLVAAPFIEEKSLEELWKERPQAPLEEPPEIPSEYTPEMLREMLDDHYRQRLDEPNPMLDDLSPRSAIETPEGREKVAAWLKTAENYMLKASRRAAIADYDFTWMWVELGVEDLRH